MARLISTPANLQPLRLGTSPGEVGARCSVRTHDLFASSSEQEQFRGAGGMQRTCIVVDARERRGSCALKEFCGARWEMPAGRIRDRRMGSISGRRHSTFSCHDKRENRVQLDLSEEPPKKRLQSSGKTEANVAEGCDVAGSKQAMAASSRNKEEPNVLHSCSMEEAYENLARRLLDSMTTVAPDAKYIVGLAGPPGAGKSTVAKEVVSRLNAMWNDERFKPGGVKEIAVAVPMDGFHLFRWQLDAMEDPVEAHARRGAPWTFDPVGLKECLTTLRLKGAVGLPSFDHGVGDPVPEDIYVNQGHKVVLVEGNYLLLTDGAWNDLGSLFDERWFIDVDIEEAMRRVENRHVTTGKPPEVAKWRIAYNDRPNAELIQESKWNADLLIPSIPLSVSESVK